MQRVRIIIVVFTEVAAALFCAFISSARSTVFVGRVCLRGVRSLFHILGTGYAGRQRCIVAGFGSVLVTLFVHAVVDAVFGIVLLFCIIAAALIIIVVLIVVIVILVVLVVVIIVLVVINITVGDRIGCILALLDFALGLVDVALNICADGCGKSFGLILAGADGRDPGCAGFQCRVAEEGTDNVGGDDIHTDSSADSRGVAHGKAAGLCKGLAGFHGIYEEVDVYRFVLLFFVVF